MSTGDTDPYRFDDAAYVMGALSPDERLEFEAHLLSCSDCSARVREVETLPALLADVDQIMGVLQQDLTTVKLDGPMEEGADAKLVPFGEAGDALRRFIVGEVQTETRGR